MCHPLYYINYDDRKLSFDNDEIIEKISKNEFTWENLVSGFGKKSENFNVNSCNVYMQIFFLSYTFHIALHPLLQDNQIF